jgi:hypothetical protein
MLFGALLNPEGLDMPNQPTRFHWKTLLAACALGLLIALFWVEVAEGNKDLLHILQSLRG